MRVNQTEASSFKQELPYFRPGSSVSYCLHIAATAMRAVLRPDAAAELDDLRTEIRENEETASSQPLGRNALRDGLLSSEEDAHELRQRLDRLLSCTDPVIIGMVLTSVRDYIRSMASSEELMQLKATMGLEQVRVSHLEEIEADRQGERIRGLGKAHAAALQGSGTLPDLHLSTTETTPSMPALNQSSGDTVRMNGGGTRKSRRKQ